MHFLPLPKAETNDLGAAEGFWKVLEELSQQAMLSHELQTDEEEDAQHHAASALTETRHSY